MPGPPYGIRLTAAATLELRALRAFDRRRIVDSLKEQLATEPLRPARNRKHLGARSAEFSELDTWELRVGEYRIFYHVDEGARLVRVWAVRLKPPGKTTGEILS